MDTNIISLQISQPNGWSGKVEINLECSVELLKEQIECFSNIPVKEQKLIFRGRILENSSLLSDYKLNSDSAIILSRLSPAKENSSQSPIKSLLMTNEPKSEFSNPFSSIDNSEKIKTFNEQLKRKKQEEENGRAKIRKQIQDDRDIYRMKLNNLPNSSSKPIEQQSEKELNLPKMIQFLCKSPTGNFTIKISSKYSVLDLKTKVFEETKIPLNLLTSVSKTKLNLFVFNLLISFQIVYSGTPPKLLADNEQSLFHIFFSEIETILVQRKFVFPNQLDTTKKTVSPETIYEQLKKQKQDKEIKILKIKKQIEDDRTIYRLKLHSTQSNSSKPSFVEDENVIPKLNTESKPESFSLLCRSSNGNFTINISSYSSLRELKKIISERTKIPISSLSIYSEYPPKELENDDQSLSHFFFSEHATISIQIKLVAAKPSTNSVFFPDANIQLPFVPEEVWALIWNLLSLADILNCSTVCKDWNRSIWKTRKTIALFDTMSCEYLDSIDDKLMIFIHQKCHQLVKLDLRGTQISDNGFRYLQNQIRLRTILIGHSTKISDRACKFIAELTGLESLTIENSSYITDHAFRHLTSLQRLSHLCLQRIALTGLGLKYIGVLSMLESFTWNSSGYQNSTVETNYLQNLQKLTQLKELNLNYNNMTEESIKLLSTKLRALSLSFNHLEEKDVAAISNFTCLRSLTLSNCDLRDNCIQFISNLQNLEVLNISGNLDLTDKSMKELIPRLLNLTSFSIKECSQLTNDSILEIRNHLHHLQTLSLSGLATKEMVESLIPLSSLTDLDLSNSKLEGKAISNLCNFSHLEKLHLANCVEIPARSFNLFSNCQYRLTLKVLDLSATHIVHIETICKSFPHLETLALSSTRIDDESLQTLSFHPNLKKVILYDCANITIKGIKYLTQKRIQVLQDLVNFNKVHTLI